MQQNETTIAHARRPAILTYSTSITSTASTFANLPLYILGLRKESEELIVPMFEGVEFAKGESNVPQAANIVVEEEKIQIYNIRLRIIAKLSGLRWILYNHRILSFFVFTTAFWASSITSMALVWLALTYYLAAEGDQNGITKEEGSSDSVVKDESDEAQGSEDPELSDTSRTFPTLGRQKPLRFSGSAINEEEEGPSAQTTIRPLDIAAAEADDEDDIKDEVGGSSTFRDSGIGTGREEDRGGGAQRRRKGAAEGRE